ncbi:MAG: 1-acyl-sn-glycerol-3-phosphate acyltransferase [Desulfobacteraceae bacterium]|nr:MAG: 1-acyl-sn-glycerol-3-phosphate acyltransferase [Desulfobacteraceae bacterium]
MEEISQSRRLKIVGILHTMIVVVWTVFSTIFFGILAILASFFDRKGNLCHIVARSWGRSILFAARIKVTVTGLSDIDPSRSYIYMSNHQSNFDIPVLLSHLAVQFRWLAKAELFRIPLFGMAMRRSGYISIDRTDRRSAFRSLENAAEIIRNGTSVMIFPEGTRSRDGSIQAFKKGGFVLAASSGVPIVPIVMHGTHRIMPKDRLEIAPGSVSVQIQKPIDTSGYTRKTKDDLMEKVRETICEAFERGNLERT